VNKQANTPRASSATRSWSEWAQQGGIKRVQRMGACVDILDRRMLDLASFKCNVTQVMPLAGLHKSSRDGFTIPRSRDCNKFFTTIFQFIFSLG
jgi:hypothetical protein